MPLRDFECTACRARFEAIVSASEKESDVKCPKCGEKKARKLVSRFAIGGQGNLRESTMHGCHPGFTGVEHDHEHDHGHDHDDGGSGGDESGE